MISSTVLAEATSHPRNPRTTVSPQLIADVQGYAAETQNGDAHVERWTRVLAAFGEVYHASPMTAQEAREFANQFSQARWGPIATEIERIEDAIATYNAPSGNAYSITIGDHPPSEPPTLTITEGDKDSVATIRVKLGGTVELVNTSGYTAAMTFVDVNERAAVLPDNQGRHQNGVTATTQDFDRLICLDGGAGGRIAMTLTQRNEQSLIKADYALPNQLSGGCPQNTLFFTNGDYNKHQKVRFIAGHDADAFDHTVPVYVRAADGYGKGITYTVLVHIIDDDKNKTPQEAFDEYRIADFEPHSQTSMNSEANYPPARLQLVGAGDGRATLQWDSTTHGEMWYMGVSDTSVSYANIANTNTHELRNLEIGKTYRIGITDCQQSACIDDNVRITIPLEYEKYGVHAATIHDTTNTSAIIKWKPVANADLYHVEIQSAIVSTNSSGGYSAHDYYAWKVVKGTSWSVTHLEPGTTYDVTITPAEGTIYDYQQTYYYFLSGTTQFTTPGGNSTSIRIDADSQQASPLNAPLDITPPTLNLNGSDHITLSYNTTSFVDPGAECVDETDGLLTVHTAGSVDVQMPGNYTITYDCTDSSNNSAPQMIRTVTVLDPPADDKVDTVTTYTVNATLVANVQNYATETHHGPVHVERWNRVLAAFGTIQHSDPMTATEAQTYADRGWKRWVPVVEALTALEAQQSQSTPDTTAPIISMTGASPITINFGDTYTDAGATCTDDIDPNPTLTINNPVNTSASGNYTITYACMDSAGNSAALVSRTVIVSEQSSYTIDPALIATVQGYVDTANNPTSKEKWTRALAGLGAVSNHSNPMTAQEAQINAYKFDPNRWNPVIYAMAALHNSTVDKPAALISAVQDYAAETHVGSEHVDRWNRVLAALGVGSHSSVMTAAEAQTYADNGWKRWVPVAEALQQIESQS